MWLKGFPYYSYWRKATGWEFFVPAQTLIAVKLLSCYRHFFPQQKKYEEKKWKVFFFLRVRSFPTTSKQTCSRKSRFPMTWSVPNGHITHFRSIYSHPQINHFLVESVSKYLSNPRDISQTIDHVHCQHIVEEVCGVKVVVGASKYTLSSWCGARWGCRVQIKN